MSADLSGIARLGLPSLPTGCSGFVEIDCFVSNHHPYFMLIYFSLSYLPQMLSVDVIAPEPPLVDVVLSLLLPSFQSTNEILTPLRRIRLSYQHSLDM